MVSAMNCPWLYDGMTMLMRRQRELSDICSGNCGLSAIHRQPVWPGGSRGSSVDGV
jgi:hypothetical protein